MELIKVAARRSFWSEVLYIVLNVALAVALLLVVRAFAQPYLAILLVVLSKWRVFAVRPRYWLLNIQSNLVDAIVGFSTIVLLYLADASLGLQSIVTVLYIMWLLVLKPRSKRRDMVHQAGVAQFLGLIAVCSFSASLPSSVFVIACGIIAYVCAHHVTSAYSEPSGTLLAMAYAFIAVELSWVYYHWMLAYPVVADIRVPQLAIVMLVIGFVAQLLFDSYQSRGKLQFRSVRMPLSFLIVTLGLVLLTSRYSIVV